MIPEEAIQMIASKCVPLSIPDASARISEFANGESKIEGLIGLVFFDLNQFTKGMSESGWNLSVKEWRVSPSELVKTYQATTIDKDGTEWGLLLNEIGQTVLEVVNVWKEKRR